MTCCSPRRVSSVDKLEDDRSVPEKPCPDILGLRLLPGARNCESVSDFIPVDIIFVHGLGGSARETWTHRPSKQFWPLWLYRREKMNNVRLLTFGYDAEWQNLRGPKNVLGIRNFAHQLLDYLNLHYRKYGDVRISFEFSDG